MRGGAVQIAEGSCTGPGSGEGEGRGDPGGESGKCLRRSPSGGCCNRMSGPHLPLPPSPTWRPF